MSNFRPRPEQPTNPRSRGDIEDDMYDRQGYSDLRYEKAIFLSLEVLLDIREMLEKVVNPIYVVENIDHQVIEKVYGHRPHIFDEGAIQ